MEQHFQFLSLHAESGPKKRRANRRTLYKAEVPIFPPFETPFSFITLLSAKKTSFPVICSSPEGECRPLLSCRLGSGLLYRSRGNRWSKIENQNFVSTNEFRLALDLSSFNPATKPGSDDSQSSSEMGNKSTYDARETNVSSGHQFAKADGPDQPLSFHRVHGSNIRLYSNGSIARREQSFCKALSFSSRPIRRNEKFGFRIIECDDEWSGALRIGITNLNPLDIRNDLPKYACPDLINTQRSWAKGVGERYCKKGNYFTFSVNASGEMMFSVNGHPRGMFLTGINAREMMWAVVDVYGNCRAVEFLKGGQAVDTFHTTVGDNVWLSEDRTMAAQVRSGDAAKSSCVMVSHALRPSSILPTRVIKLNGAHGNLTAGVILCQPDRVHKSWLQSGAAALANQGEGYIFKKDVIGKLRLFDDMTFIVDDKNVLYVLVGGSRLRTACSIQGNSECYLFFELSGSVSGIQICSESNVSVAGLRQQTVLTDGSERTSPRKTSAEIRCSTAVRRSTAPQPLRVVIPPIERQDRVASTDLPGMARAGSLPNTSQQSACLTSTSSSPTLGQRLPGLTTERWLASRSCRDPLPERPIAQHTTPPAHPIRVILPPIGNKGVNGLVESAGHSPNSSRSRNNTESLSTRGADTSRQSGDANSSRSSENVPLLSNDTACPANVDQVLEDRGRLLVFNYHQSYANVASDSPPTAVAEWGDDQEEQDECKICMVSRVDSAFYPCGHYSMCYPCAKLTFRKQGVCPICRKPIRDVLKIFKS
ncbi:zinc finger, C3HC4 type [Trichuris suis]|nr:zinc finger, C3HC4 type [Trichuris suis]